MRQRVLGAVFGGSAVVFAVSVVGGSLTPYRIQALPSYARQTGETCAACHVGGFGPQLTPHGRAFKLGGYSDGKTVVPLSGMAVANFTHTAQDRAEPVSNHDGVNDNVALQEASIFVAGRLAKGLGTFIQATYSEIDRATALDQVDVRYARPMTLGGRNLTLGIDVNNNPTLQDPFNSVGAWSFPYTSPDLGFGNGAASPLILGGVEHQALGVSAYGWYDNSLYVEAGGYRSLNPGTLGTFGIAPDAGSIRGVAPYWRVAYQKDFGKQVASIGLIGMHAELDPDRAGGTTDKYTDWGVDATYQFLGNRKNIVSLNASYIHERQTLDHAVFVGEADRARHTLDSLSGDLSWYHDKHYGVTVGAFHTRGTRDQLLFVPNPEDGSRVGAPNTDGYIGQVDWTPFGGEDQSTFANLRLGIQYKGYTKFNGGVADYDGSGRSASDNNTLSAFAWLAF